MYNTIWGQRSVYLKGGIQDGQIIRRSGEGYKKGLNIKNGDHYLTIVVKIPLKLS